jgi:membrane associated rhomboid family serine protease
MFYQSASHGPGAALWLKTSAFVPGKYDLYKLQSEYLPMVNMMFWSTFCSGNIWQMLGNAYFLWVFGSLVELRLAPGKYLTLVGVCIFGSWIIQAYEAGLTSSGLYLGPGLLTAALIGAYMVFFPEKKINPGGSIGRSTRFFKNEPDPDPSAGFGISPWWIITAFVAFQVGMHFMLNSMPVHYDNMRLVAGVGAFILGLVTCAILVALAAQGVQGNPLKILAIQRYRALRALDFGHEEAVEGTARLMCCPVEQVKVWIAKGSGALPQQPTG